MNSDMRQSVLEYLLGELPPEQAGRFKATLLIDPGLKAEVERLRPVVGRLEGHGEDAWVALEPPPLDIAAIVASDLPAGSSAIADEAAGSPSRTGASLGTDSPIGSDSPLGPGSPLEALPEAASEAPSASDRGSQGKPRRSLAEVFGVAWPRIAVGAFSALLLLAVGVGVGMQLGGDGAVSGGEPTQTAQLQAFGEEVPPGASGEVLLTSADGGNGDQMTLDVSGLRQSSDREFYELWLLGDKGELIALGSFRVPSDGSSTIEVPLPVNPDKYRYFDVSIQPENGDPQHSGRSVLRGLTSS